MESETCETGSWSPGMSGLGGQEGLLGTSEELSVLCEAIRVVWFCFVFTPELSLEGGVFCPGT